MNEASLNLIINLISELDTESQNKYLKTTFDVYGIGAYRDLIEPHRMHTLDFRHPKKIPLYTEPKSPRKIIYDITRGSDTDELVRLWDWERCVTKLFDYVDSIDVPVTVSKNAFYYSTLTALRDDATKHSDELKRQ